MEPQTSLAVPAPVCSEQHLVATSLERIQVLEPVAGASHGEGARRERRRARGAAAGER